MIRFCANLSLLFAELDFLDRFEAAARAGFDAVEFWWPGDADAEQVPEVVEAHGLAVPLFNFAAGDMAAGDRGLLSDPERQDEFRANVPVALALAERIGCTRLNALVGTEIESVGRAAQLELAAENIGWAADQARPQGATIMIEAVNTIENGPYLLARTEASARFIARVGRPNVALQYDAYHMQRMEGNITENLRDHFAGIGHVQIADSPGRGEPGTGEINFAWVLGELDRLGYDGYVGLEYKPAGGAGTTVEGLSWLAELGFSLDQQEAAAS